ncbi:GNAT family N-acetyltransferase [Ornithinibacillus xuwenensis]|uniref:GNAT family N-acetyltransferase n=1 Tax=Ornithinibacillus xuwenensis TaxID=3144668 RepID=A0ABU9XHS1_9BACI
MIGLTPLIMEEDVLHRVNSLYNHVWNVNGVEFVQRIKRHFTYPGFIGILASQGAEVMGFVYGYASVKGQYYHELLCQQLSVSEQRLWLEDCFELVELAVHPSIRRQRLGQRLVQSLMEQVTCQTAILTTQKNNIPALGLYKQLNWEVVKDDFFPTQQQEAYLIMGKEL